MRGEEALTLFISALGRTNTDPVRPSERAAAERIVAALGNHTLAVKLAGAYAGAERRDLEAMARELGNTAGGLTLPGDDETPEAVRRTFSLSLDALPADAQRLFAGLAVFATPECGRQAVLAVGRALGQPHPEQSLHLLLTRALVDPATDETLPPESDRELLRLHPLLRALADNLYHRWPEADRNTAALAAAQYLASYAEAHQIEHFVLAADEGNLTGTIEWAHTHDYPALVVELTHGMREFWAVRGRYREGVKYLAWGVSEATQMADRGPSVLQTEAELDLVYGVLLDFVGRIEDSGLALQRSLVAFRRVENRRGEGAALGALGEVAMYHGQYDAAEAHLQQSLIARREVGDRRGEGKDLCNLGALARVQGRFQPAVSYLEQALTIARDMDDRQNICSACAYLGAIAWRRGKLDTAEEYLQEALTIDRDIGDRQGEAADLMAMANIFFKRRQLDQAEVCLKQSFAIAYEVGDIQTQGSALSELGRLDVQRGQHQEATRHLEQAIAISRENGDPVGRRVASAH